MTKIRPDDATIQQLCEQHPHSQITIVDTVGSGLSGSVVLLVMVKSESRDAYNGVAYAKIDRKDHLIREYELHCKAAEQDCALYYMPAVIGPIGPVNGWSMVIYQPAHNTMTARSLGQIVQGAAGGAFSVGEIVGQIKYLLSAIRACWHTPDALAESSQPESIPVLFRELIDVGGKDRLSEIEARVSIYDLPSRHNYLVSFKPGINIELPNPFAYMLDESLWQGINPIIAPRTPTHGDLHGGNIICRVTDEHLSDELPWLIDFAQFNPAGLPFFDLAYLELDLLLRCLPASGPDSNWQQWLNLTNYLCSDILPEGDPPGLGVQSAWRIIQPIREYVRALLDDFATSPGIVENFEQAWWLATTTVGTLVTRRSRTDSRQQRIVTLLYAARSLKRLLSLLRIQEREQGKVELWWREPPWEGSPFPGLVPFKTEQSTIFFGRNREINELGNLLMEPNRRFLAVVGASGSGKSSLIWAGLLPRLTKGGDIEGSRNWITVRFTPGGAGNGDPFAAFVPTLIDKLPELANEDYLALRLAEYPLLLDSLCEQALAKRPAGACVLLFIDQFEEIFTLVNRDDLRVQFVEMLQHIAESERVRAIITLRADFYENCFNVPGLIELLQGHYMLPAPNQMALSEMIRRPAERAGISFENGLVERILADTGTDSGALALLAYTLEQLYEVNKHEKLLTHADYDALGNVQGAIKTRAEQTFKMLKPAAQEALSSVFQRLVGIDENTGAVTRQRALAAGFLGDENAAAFLKAFVQARLLVTDRDKDGHAIIEVAHEALLRSWPKLANWIDATKEDLKLLQKLKRDAAEWERRSHDPSILWRHGELQKAASMIMRLQPTLTDAERYFTRPEYEWLLDDPNTSHWRRADLGDWLAQIGDPRPGVGLNAAGLPDVVWCDVPEMGVKISKYPITYAQYRSFVEAEDGYRNPHWWDGLAERQGTPGQQVNPITNCPADSISWYDAMAFSRWLTHKLFPDMPEPILEAAQTAETSIVPRLNRSGVLAIVNALNPQTGVKVAPRAPFRHEAPVVSLPTPPRIMDVRTAMLRLARHTIVTLADEIQREPDPERRLWVCLRQQRLAGLPFVHRYSIPFTDTMVNFFSQHSLLGLDVRAESVSGLNFGVEKVITTHIGEHRVLYLIHQEIMDDLESVLAAILLACQLKPERIEAEVKLISNFEEAERMRQGRARPLVLKTAHSGDAERRKEGRLKTREWLIASRVRLPTDNEWMAAALGTQTLYHYPWGPDFNPAFANTDDSALGRSTAVGMYPIGQSPIGAQDMTGNVWEWTLTERDERRDDDITGREPRLLRGGSWRRRGSDVPVQVAFGYSPELRYDDVGFRVVLTNDLNEPL